MTTAQEPGDQWEQTASALRAYRDAQREAWGGLDDVVLARYLAGEASVEERQAVEQAAADRPQVREALAILREVLCSECAEVPNVLEVSSTEGGANPQTASATTPTPDAQDAPCSGPRRSGGRRRWLAGSRYLQMPLALAASLLLLVGVLSSAFLVVRSARKSGRDVFNERVTQSLPPLHHQGIKERDPPVVSAGPGRGTVVLRGVPSDARILVDGKEVIATALPGGVTLTVPTGEVVVDISRKGYQPRKLTLSVSEDKPVSVDVTLMRLTLEELMKSGSRTLDEALKAGSSWSGKYRSINGPGEFYFNLKVVQRDGERWEGTFSVGPDNRLTSPQTRVYQVKGTVSGTVNSMVMFRDLDEPRRLWVTGKLRDGELQLRLSTYDGEEADLRALQD